MRLLFACGGTAGHINPALAVAAVVSERRPEAEILFAGAEGGMECDLVPRAGYEIRTIPASRLMHSVKPSAIVHNGRVALHMSASLRSARKLLRAFRPEVALGTGGYVSYPILREAARMGVPTVVHESNALPGLTTKLLALRAARVLVSFPEAKKAYHHPERVTVTGTPVHSGFYLTDRREAREALGLADDRPLLVSYFGSLGARDMNRFMVDFIARSSANSNFHHIHATGRYGWAWMPDAIEKAGAKLSEFPHIRLLEYIYDMPTAMAAADLLITRAGAATLAELMAAGKPAILVPSPNVASNHQEKNARALSERGAAVMLREDACSGLELLRLAERMLSDEVKRASMAKELRGMAMLDAADQIYQVLTDVIR